MLLATLSYSKFEIIQSAAKRRVSKKI